ncbi:MAG: hypothetical protein N4A50_05205 [Vallitalea sp.]|jgi:alpha-tubulin suppressor-like RCC1 family protein|nr:hypothetical protein [Vallitalea sp.]
MKKRLGLVIIFAVLLNINIYFNVYAQEDLESEFVDYSIGYKHTIALKKDGTVWAWGSNEWGQLGDGTQTDSLVPVKVKGLTNIINISAGFQHNLAIKDDGTVWAWGSNEQGESGGESPYCRVFPAQIKGLTDIKMAVAARSCSIVVKNDGTAWAWGNNIYGLLGDGTTIDRLTPVQVKGLTDVKTIVADNYHSKALKNDGTVWAWGNNDYGQLGNGTTTGGLTPVEVKGLTDVKTIDVGGSYCRVIKNDGTIWVWGANHKGQFGNGEVNLKNLTPIQITGLKDYKTIIASGSHSIALKNDGTVWAWGDNTHGQLGDGTNASNVSTPLQVPGLKNVNKIFSNYYQNIIVKNDGTVWAWGDNAYGQLGDGAKENKSMPVEVIYLTPPSNLIALGENKQVSLSWDKTDDIQYTIKRATTHNGPYKEIATGITDESYIDTNVTNNTTYYYVVVSIVNDSKSSNSNEVSATPLEIQPPTNIIATEKDKSVVLNWAKVTNANNYIIKRSTTTGSGYNIVAENVIETTYSDTDVINGTTYYYIVKAKNDAGESEDSVEVTATPKEPIDVPTAPTSVNTTSGNKRVQLNWSGVSGADSYIIKRSTTAGSGYNIIAENVTETTYVDTEVSNGITYYYVVIAKNEIGQTDNSAEVTATPNLILPTMPTNVRVIGNNLKVNLSWDWVLGANGYIIKRSTSKDGNYSTIISDITATTYEDTSLTNGTIYYYMIIAKNEAGESPNSAIISAMPLNEPPAIPTNLSIENGNKSVNITWSSAKGAFTYKVKRATTSAGPYTLVADNITGTTYTDTNLTNGISYYYVISAVNSKGESNNSPEVIALPDITKPNSPTGINVSTSDKRITITWNKADNADSYIVKKSTTAGGPYSVVANDLTKTMYTESGLTNGTSYYYIIIAKNKKGESKPSSEIEAIPGISKPKNIIIQVVDKQIKLSWDPVANAEVYKIKRAENIDGPYTIISDGVSGTNYVDKSIKENKLYYYVISAVNSLGESPDTEPVSALVKDSIDKRYILLVVLNNGMQKEYDIDTSTADRFINWYFNRANGIGSPIFTLFNHEKDDVFENSKDYIGFNTILYYQVNEYKVNIHN